MFKRKKQQQPKQEKIIKLQAPKVPIAKATVKTMGTGELEFSENALKFTLKKSLFGKQKEVAIKIPVAEIESIRQIENRFLVVWNGITDTFTLQKTEAFKPILEKLTASLEEVKSKQEPKEEQTTEQKENREAQEHMRKQIPVLLNSAEEIVDRLFDLLRTLQGKINWSKVEEHLKNAKQSTEDFTDLNLGKVNVNFAKLSEAVNAHVPTEAGKETLSLIKQLNEYFASLTSKPEASAQVHPNYRDAHNALRTYYTLNDIVLGLEVGDEETVNESFAFSKLLDKMEKESQVTGDVSLLKEAIYKLARAKGAESNVVECRALLRAHLCELTKSDGTSSNFLDAEMPRKTD